MKEVDFLDAVGRVDKQYIEECITYKPPKKANIWIKRISAAAACLIIAFSAIVIVKHMNQPVIIDENGFHIENGVLLSYTGSETDITIPEKVKTIADFTFLSNRNADKIEVVRLGTSVRKVEVNAFAGLDNLSDLIIAENNMSFVYKEGLIMSSDGSILLRYEREDETSFTIPESVRFVAAHAVQGTELEEISYGENLEYIGYNAFAGNYNLKAIYLPDSLKYICEGAFSGCTSAVDGYIPDGAQLENEAFWCVPFYNSQKAGQMCPGEEIARGLITPSEAIVKTDLYSLTEQISCILASMRGDKDYKPDESAMFADTSAIDIPKVPENLVIPAEFSIDDLSFTDNGWGNTGIYDVQILLPAGDYTIVMQAYGYSVYEALYWKDVRFRIANLYYMQDPNTADPEDTVSAFGWTAVFGHDGELYSGITYTHENGTIIHSFLSTKSDTPYVLTFSPDGTRVAVESTYGGKASFYIQALNGDKLISPNYDYNDYLDRYYGQYQAGTLKWVDNDNIEGVNEFGRFRFNIYEFRVTLLDEDITAEASRLMDYYNIRFVIPQVWKETEEGYSDMVRRNREAADERIQLTTNVRRADQDADDSEFLPNDKGYAYRMTEEASKNKDIRGIYHFAFKCENDIVFDFIATVYKDDPADYLESVIMPVVNSIAIEKKNTSIGVDYSEFRNSVNSMGEYNSFPPYSYTFTVYGLSSDVSFKMRNYDNPESITAFGRTLNIDESVHFYGNCSVDIFEYNGAVIFTWSFYDIGYVYIIGDGFAQVIEPGDSVSVMLYLDDSGKLKYKRSNNHLADIIQTGGLSAATGYDDFLYCIGSASIENGKLILGDAEEDYTIGDKYDLDEEFVKGGYNRRYGSIEEVFESNRNLPDGVRRNSTVLSRLLSMTVSELQTAYGALKVEYSEEGPGQPVYSMEYLPGVMPVFHGWSMYDTLTDDMIPDELIINEDYGRAICGLKVGQNVKDCTEKINWSEAEYSLINVTINLKAEFDLYTVTYTVSGRGLNLPLEEIATDADWEKWEESYLKNPTGEIYLIRIELK